MFKFFRSECVSEKLLTHWLSICLYHYLKDQPGSHLFSLYKAIKIFTERGPIDYITNCGKYTLSEDRLITTDDTEINSVVLVHFALLLLVFRNNNLLVIYKIESIIGRS